MTHSYDIKIEAYKTKPFKHFDVEVFLLLQNNHKSGPCCKIIRWKRPEVWTYDKVAELKLVWQHGLFFTANLQKTISNFYDSVQSLKKCCLMQYPILFNPGARIE